MAKTLTIKTSEFKIFQNSCPETQRWASIERRITNDGQADVWMCEYLSPLSPGALILCKNFQRRMERYWQPWRGCQPLLSVIISYFLYLDSWFIRADIVWTLLFRCWLIINIPDGDREKNRWMTQTHNNFQNHMTAQLPFSMTHSNHFLGHSNGTKILTKMLFVPMA